MTDHLRPAGDAPTPTSPLCPVHFPGAAYLGELVGGGFYLGRLAQDHVVDQHGTAHSGMTGRYGLFLEDGGCGQLAALLPDAPTPVPLTAQQSGELDAVFERHEAGDLPDLPAEALSLANAELTWITHARRWTLLLTPEDGHRLVQEALRAGFDPGLDSPLAQLNVWLYDRAGHLASAG